MEPSIQVLMVDDCPIVYEGIRDAFQSEGAINLVGVAQESHQIKTLLLQFHPDILLLDISVSGIIASEIIQFTQQTCPNTKILVFSTLNSPAYVQALLAAGISGYILKSEKPDVLLDGLRVIANGGCCFSQPILTVLTKQPHSKPKANMLTSRENQVLHFIGQGYSNQQIANELHLAKQTVANYICCIYEKIDVQSRAKAILWQIENQPRKQ